MKAVHVSSAFALILSACTTLRPADFSRGTPVFRPDRFFTGHTESSGVMENRRGEPTRQVTTRTTGRWHEGTLHIEQDLALGQKTSHRSWELRRIDEHHFEATANDIVGTARGEAWGNIFHWSFILAASPGNPFANVRMSQWMYLQPDGETLINHTTYTKAGLVVAQTTEQFRRKPDSPGHRRF